MGLINQHRCKLDCSFLYELLLPTCLLFRILDLQFKQKAFLMSFYCTNLKPSYVNWIPYLALYKTCNVWTFTSWCSVGWLVKVMGNFEYCKAIDILTYISIHITWWIKMIEFWNRILRKYIIQTFFKKVSLHPK